MVFSRLWLVYVEIDGDTGATGEKDIAIFVVPPLELWLKPFAY